MAATNPGMSPENVCRQEQKEESEGIPAAFRPRTSGAHRLVLLYAREEADQHRQAT